MNNSSSLLIDKLTGALIGLAKSTEGNESLISDTTDLVMLEALSATLNASSDNVIEEIINRVREEKRRIVPNCFECAMPCGRTADLDINELKKDNTKVTSLKLALLLAVKSLAVHAYQATLCGCRLPSVTKFIYTALIVIGIEGLDEESLAQYLAKAGELMRDL